MKLEMINMYFTMIGIMLQCMFSFIYFYLVIRYTDILKNTMK